MEHLVLCVLQKLTLCKISYIYIYIVTKGIKYTLHTKQYFIPLVNVYIYIYSH